MSIIGTRPPLISETNFYELHHRARLAIKPGITGMWQVSGRSDITDFEEVVRLDKEYITRLKRWIDRVESFRYEKIEVQFKNREWKEMLPEEWFEEASFSSLKANTSLGVQLRILHSFSTVRIVMF